MTRTIMSSMIACGLTAFALLAVASIAQAATYYVTVGGDDGNGGSNPTTDALATLERAVELAGDDDTIRLGGGTYYLLR